MGDTDADLQITHTFAEGTLLTGTTREQGRKGAPVRTVLDKYAWRWGSSIDCWYQRSTRDKPAGMYRIAQTAAELRDLGFSVAVEVDNDPRPMAEREADRAERMEDRAAALHAKAGRRAGQAADRQAAADVVFDNIPLGQPYLVDHYSYKADRNRRERAWNNLGKAIQLRAESMAASSRADAAENHMLYRYNPLTVANRIRELEALARKCGRELGRQLEYYLDEAAGKYRRRMVAAKQSSVDHWTPILANTETELEWWRTVRAEQIAAGEITDYGPHNVAVGDRVQVKHHTSWYPVKRCNAKSVSISALIGLGSDDHPWTDRVPWDQVTAHAPAQEATDG